MFGLLLLFCAVISLTYSQSNGKFCDDRHKNSLIDLIFNFGETVYVYRSGSGFWLLKYHNISDEWQVLSGPHEKRVLFAGLKEDYNVRAVFGISSYEMCDRLAPRCQNENRNFNPTNITFVFGERFGTDPQDFRILRRVSQTRFEALKDNEKMKPWSSISDEQTKMLEGVDSPIGVAIFMKAKGSYGDYALLVTDKYIFEFNIYDTPTTHNVRASIMDKKIANAHKIGGIVTSKGNFFFIANYVYVYEFDSQINPLNLTYWQFFRCDPKEKISTTQSSTAKTTGGDKSDENSGETVDSVVVPDPGELFSDPTTGRTTEAMESGVESKEFCDPKHENQLFDLVFEFEDSVYVFRKPNSFWILKYNYLRGKWFQSSGPFKRSQLFSGMIDDLKIRAVLAITSYNKSNQNDNPNFDPSRVTFVFDNEYFRLYRRINETRFIAIAESDRNVPWHAWNKSHNILTTILSPIGAALQMPAKNDMRSVALFLNDDFIFVYIISDKTQDSTKELDVFQITNREIKRGVKNGGICLKGEALFFISNKIWKFTSDFSEPLVRKSDLNYWQFFNCSIDMETDQTIRASTDGQTGGLNSEAKTSEESDQTIETTKTESTDGDTLFTTGSRDTEQTDYNKERSTHLTDTSHELDVRETTASKVTAFTPDLLDYSMDAQTYTEEYTERTIHTTVYFTLINKYRELFRNLSIAVLLTSVGTAIIVTIFAVFAYSSLSKELS